MTADRTDVILVVENEPLIAMDLEGMLHAAGFPAVDHVASVSEALDWLERGAPHLLILDLVMRDGSTGPVARRLRAAGKPFVVYSGHSRREAAHETTFGDAVWLSKPCRPSDLESAITEALGLPGR